MSDPNNHVTRNNSIPQEGLYPSKLKLNIMTSKFVLSLVGGISATIVMTLVMVMGAMMGMPKMAPWEMLADMMGTSILVGWIMHFMIGIIFTLIYAYFFMGIVKGVSRNTFKGVLFGIAIFIMAQVAMALMGKGMPEEGMFLMVMGSLFGHIIFGIVVALIVKDDVALS